jgi:hypothetical protein
MLPDDKNDKIRIEKDHPEIDEPTPSPEKKWYFQSDFFSTSTTRDIIAYVLLVIGIILLFFQPLYGGLIIGAVGGIYFSNEVIAFIRTIEAFIDEQGIARSIVLAVLTLAFFIAAPAIFVGAALVIALKFLIIIESK